MLTKGNVMSSLGVRDHLVLPAAVALALGLVTVAQPNPGASSPRFAGVSAIRLQAEVTGFVAGVADGAVDGLASAPLAAVSAAPAAAASAAPAAATASALGAPYPSTFLEKWVDSLPPEIQSIVSPPLYVMAMVVGAILGVVYTIFGWPKDLMPAAAVAPPAKRGTAAAAAAEPVGAPADSSVTSATPGVDRAPEHAPEADGGAPADTGAAPAPAGQTRGRHPAPVAVAEDIAVAEDVVTTAAAVGAVAPRSVTPQAPPTAVATEAAPAAVAADAAPAAVAADATPAAVAAHAATGAIATDAPAADVAADPAPAASQANDAPDAGNHPSRSRIRSSQNDSADSASARTVRRSAR